VLCFVVAYLRDHPSLLAKAAGEFVGRQLVCLAAIFLPVQVFRCLDLFLFVPTTSALRSKIMSEPTSDRNGDELPYEHTEGDKKPCASSYTPREGVLGYPEAVPAAFQAAVLAQFQGADKAAGKSKKKLDRKRGAGKSAKPSKRHKKDPLPGECPSHDDVLAISQAVQATDKSKKKLGQKRDAGKSAKASKRHKQDYLPSECPTCGVPRPCKVHVLAGGCMPPRSNEDTDDDDFFLQFARSEAHQGSAQLQYCQLDPKDPAKGNSCDSHCTLVIDRFVCDRCIDRGNEISDDYWC
jgi:hypothetical protein